MKFIHLLLVGCLAVPLKRNAFMDDLRQKALAPDKPGLESHIALLEDTIDDIDDSEPGESSIVTADHLQSSQKVRLEQSRQKVGATPERLQASKGAEPQNGLSDTSEVTETAPEPEQGLPDTEANETAPVIEEVEQQLYTMKQALSNWWNSMTHYMYRVAPDMSETMKRFKTALGNPSEIAVSVSVCIFFCVVLIGGMAWYVSTAPSRPVRQPGLYTFKELLAMTSFRFYGGLLICTWLPYVLAEEGESFWPEYEALFMALGKTIMAVAIFFTPVFGYMNDRTVHPWGRRRAWFFWGVTAICIGIALCAMISAYKLPGYCYFICVFLWTFGEAVADSTSEALVPDLCTIHDYNLAAAVRSITFMSGGLVGYGLIIMGATVFHISYHWMYVYYLIAILVSAPFTIMYAVPAEEEQTRAINEHQLQGDNGVGMIRTVYMDVLNASDDFRRICLGTLIFAMSPAGMCFLLLLLRDVYGVGTKEDCSFQFAVVCIAFLLGAICASVLLTFIVMDPFKSAKGFMFLFAGTELLLPACGLISSNLDTRLAFLYVVAFVKGGAFGGCLNMMQNCVWHSIPPEWRQGMGSIGRGMAVAGTMRTLGAALGNIVVGFILQTSVWWKQESYEVGGHDVKYPIEGYFAMFTADSIFALIAVWIVWDMGSNVDGIGAEAARSGPMPRKASSLVQQ